MPLSFSHNPNPIPLQCRRGGVDRSLAESKLSTDWVAKMECLAKATAVVMIMDDSESGMLRLVDPLFLIPSKLKDKEENALKMIWKASNLSVATMFDPKIGSCGWTDTTVDLFMGNADLLGAGLEWLLAEHNVPIFNLQAILQAGKPQASGTPDLTKMSTPDPTPSASRLSLAASASTAAADGGAPDSDSDRAKAMKAAAKSKMTGAARLLKGATATINEGWHHGKTSIAKKKVSHLYTSNHQLTCSDARCVHCSCCVRRHS